MTVVWLAKHAPRIIQEGHSYVGTIEGHYAGKKHECITFVQKNSVVPSHSACPVKRDLSGVIGLPPMTDVVAPIHCAEVDIQRWTVTSDLQNAADNDSIVQLPEGLFTLE